MRILLTGGAGYIGSHTCLEMLQEGHEICVIDNFANSSAEALVRVSQISGKDFQFYEGDICDEVFLNRVFKDFQPHAVVHFAGLKAVNEGEQKPLSYYRVNVKGTLNLLTAMEAIGCNRIIFSSSATVYGNPLYLPYDEDHPCCPVNVYGRTKYAAEQLIRDWAKVMPKNVAVLLRYFNPGGAHESGLIGEDPNGIPNNLLPYISQVAVQRRPYLGIYGADYDTSDGTGVRDYLHVTDLACAHVAAIEFSNNNTGTEIFNLGTGQGSSVMEMLAAFSQTCGRDLPFKILPRRAGDLAAAWADPSKAERMLQWKAHRDIREICNSTWKWQYKNPNGYNI